MNRYKSVLVCPYLSGSDKGVMCYAASMLIRNINHIDLTICMSKYYELCYIYCLELQEMSESGDLPSYPAEKLDRLHF